jgi:peptidoglycan hydrolase CwlO-like protein
MATSMQKNKIENLEQRVEQLEMFINTLEEQNKFMKDIVTSQNDLIKFMAEQNTVNLDKVSHINQRQKHEVSEHVKNQDNAFHELLPAQQEVTVVEQVEQVKQMKKPPIGRRVM